MAIIKCKMCGGDIEISPDKTFGTCEYCGSTMTLPKVDDEQRAAAFNRGNHFRRSGEFDKALAVYERIVAEDDNDAEAHWCCALCRFGIEYVEDPATYEWLPTCHRASFDSFLEDVDYLAAVEHSDGITRRQYQKDAAKIAEVQRGILATSQNEQPFDVFLCYKETGEDGQRTRDSLMAQEVYYELTEQGYRVFFARITLEDKAGTEYEPYIFAALNSAKVMVVIGTKPEHFNAVWVKNEWSRFLSMMKKDRSKLLLPCYRDMDPYDLPEALSVLQSYDMSKIGFMQDLIRGVKKVIDAGKPQEAAKETVKETVVVHNEGGSNVQALLKRGNMALEDGEWSKADEFFEQVLNQDAECGAAYLGKFLARVECRSAKTYADAYIENVKAEAPNEKNADACEPDEAFITSCVEKYTVPGILSGNQIRQMLEFDLEYCEASSFYALRAEEAQEEFAADKDLMRAVKYASSEAKTITEDIPQTLDKLRADAQKREDAEKARITADYRKFLTETEAKLEEEHPQRLKEAEEARKAEADRQRKAKAAEKKIAIVAGIATAVIALALVIVNVIIPAVNYSKAEKYLAAGDYDNAITTFTNLGDYKDAAEQLAQTRALKEEAEEEARNARAYANAEELLANEDYDGAIAAFKKLGDYQDAASRAKDAEAQKQETENAQAYASAEALLNAREYDSAAKAFDMLGDYKDAAARALECYYIEADQLQGQGKTAEAAFTFAKVAEYKDAQERSSALWDMIPGRETITTSGGHTVALKMDGTAVSVGSYDNGERDIYDWNNIVDISCGLDHTVGLKSDGTVLAAGKDHFDHGQCDVSDWRNIIAVDAGKYYTVGLKADGTVVATGEDDVGQCDVSDWTNIVAISAGDYHTVGLKSDGTVAAVGAGEDGQCNITDWEDIVSISAGESHTVGLKADGTVVAVGNNEYGQCDVSRWFDIVAISAGDRHTVGLKADGTVIAVGDNIFNQCDVSGWTDIVAVSAGRWNTVGLKANGTAVAVGLSDDVSTWTDIKLPN
jgi:tetratricopeptide (TPR) repeat protein